MEQSRPASAESRGSPLQIPERVGRVKSKILKARKADRRACAVTLPKFPKARRHSDSEAYPLPLQGGEPTTGAFSLFHFWNGLPFFFRSHTPAPPPVEWRAGASPGVASSRPAPGPFNL
jgi:hypothetical protein